MMNHFEEHLVVFIKRNRLQSTQHSNFFKSIFIRKKQNGECDVKIDILLFFFFFFGMSSGAPVFKVRVFASDFEFLVRVNEY